MALNIKQVTDPADPVINVICGWIYDWWEEEDSHERQKIEAAYRRSVFSDRIPQTYIAYDGDVPVGTFQFAMSDNSAQVRPDVYPWLKNVYVVPQCRGKGYASEMMEYASLRLKEMGIEEMYLFTHITGLYEQSGWRFVELFDTCDPWLGEQRLYKWKCRY